MAILAVALVSMLPSPASASSKQLSVVEDDAVFPGLTNRDPDAALARAKALGADAVRVVVLWRGASPADQSRTIPPGFDPANANSPGYKWAQYDTLIDRARHHGLKVILNLAPGIPYWGSKEPGACPRAIPGRKPNPYSSCYWKPDPKLFAKFAKAAATRFKGKVALYSLYNEPNLENFLYPQSRRTKYGTVDLGGKQLRELWTGAYKAVTRVDPRMKKRVLFGETAAISAPIDTLYSALCLTREGKPYTGKLKKLQGCSKPSMLPIAGLSVHPYNQSALGGVFTRSATKSSLALGYLNRATRVLKTAEKYKRIPKGKGIYVTEFGFQTKPPDPKGLSFAGQARAVNESERLFFGDRRIKSTAQFELYDVPDTPGLDIFNTGLFTKLGTPKPARDAWRLPLVVSRLSANRVEIWGQARPASGPTTTAIQVSPSAKGPFKALRRTRTNATGYFRFQLKRGGAAAQRYRMTWKSPSGATFRSRVAAPGRVIKYRE